MDRPLVSVIIPCYNASKYVEQAVRSVMKQTYQNLEIICCDDCSTDNTLSILNRLSKEDKRLSIIHNEKNLKLITTLNKLISHAHGEYIARMDSDDICLPDRITKQLEYLYANPDMSFCGCNTWHINEEDLIVGKSSLPLLFEDNKFYLQYSSTFYHPSMMLKAEVLKNNLYDINFIHAEDYELWCRLIFEKGLKGGNLPDRLLKYRLNSFGVSQQNVKLQLESSARIFQTKKILDEDDIIPHCNIFFGLQTECFRINKYLNLQRKLLKNKKASYSKIPYIKMLSYCKHNNLKLEFLKILLTLKGFYSFTCLLLKRFLCSMLI